MNCFTKQCFCCFLWLHATAHWCFLITQTLTILVLLLHLFKLIVFSDDGRRIFITDPYNNATPCILPQRDPLKEEDKLWKHLKKSLSNWTHSSKNWKLIGLPLLIYVNTKTIKVAHFVFCLTKAINFYVPDNLLLYYIKHSFSKVIIFFTVYFRWPEWS